MTISPENERGWAMFCHLSSLLWIPLAAIGLPIPFASLVIPLIVWSARRRESNFIDYHGRESLNFQISMLIYGFVLVLIGLGIGVFLIVVVGFEQFDSNNPIAAMNVLAGAFAYVAFLIVWAIIQTIIVVIVGVQAVQGKKSRYPLTIRFIPTSKSL
ncbi:DUF4870 domain-containing protein [Spirulina major CS-329]|uniref:DUF4870 domain-containing protein n=1 Tax=Spirulina TaxID=1154 RepID=UPI00232EBC01|nr:MULTISPECIES: DUF4870 domain-containing protein [Spirulina]MDB9493871.1 DUF4870 domain-containing protein [Spirulina subsalsa CS-330]MDB9503505.1 DUF4870 domain-containing protein [Spirulina major CS-329]